MQRTKQLQSVRGFSFCSNVADIRDVENQIRERFLGVPFLNEGRDLNGLDCYGLIICIYALFGITILDFGQHYLINWSHTGENHFIENYYKQWDEVLAPQFGDVVLFKNSIGVANHAGVILSEQKFIHCCRAGVVISKVSYPVWKRRLVGYYRFKGRP